jgi:hypothetical protein
MMGSEAKLPPDSLVALPARIAEFANIGKSLSSTKDDASACLPRLAPPAPASPTAPPLPVLLQPTPRGINATSLSWLLLSPPQPVG